MTIIERHSHLHRQLSSHEQVSNLLSIGKSQDSPQSETNTDESPRSLPALSLELRFPKNLSQFQNLFELKKKFLLNQSISPADVNLSDLKAQLFACFLLKKYSFHWHMVTYLTRNGRIGVKSEMLPELCNRINTLSSCKRKEENIKLIFNWIFNFLMERIQRTQGLSKELAEEYFAERYFREAAEKSNIDIKNFYKPNFSRSPTDQLKTYNSTFIRNIKLSPKFTQELVDCLRNNFTESFSAIIEEKSYIQCNKWEKGLATQGFAPRTVQALCDMIVWNKRVKLCWSLVEAENARSVVLKNFNGPYV
jgi:hypothetical protein